MIGRGDIAARVRESGLREDVAEKDYALDWTLWGIGSDLGRSPARVQEPRRHDTLSVGSEQHVQPGRRE